MENLQLLFEKNNTYNRVKFSFYENKLVYIIKDELFSGKTIKKIINFVNALIKTYGNIKIPIVFKLECKSIVDKLSYVLFECICYYLINERRQKVDVIWNPPINISTEGIKYSALNLLKKCNNEIAFKYIKDFRNHLYKNHYRKLVDIRQKEDDSYLSKLFTNIDIFLNCFNIDETYRESVSEVISELIGNACEHSESNCLFDLDVTTDYYKVDDTGKYFGINVAIVCFSDGLIGDGIKNKILEDKYLKGRYNVVKSAYNNHKKYFDSTYKEEDFFNISAFQHKISGRQSHSETGGTGLTKLIKSLQEKADSTNCYLVSGNRALYFFQDFLRYDDNYWIGFNKENNFLNCAPDKKVLDNCCIYMPGIAYNLNFVVKKGDAIS